jgi:ferric-dicitrate binding protein FerR (iron transport regulator)
MKTFNTNNDLDIFLAKWLEGELSDNELKNLVSEDDFSAYLKLRKGIYIAEKLDAPITTTFEKIQNKIEDRKQKVRPLYKNWSVGIAASIIVLFGLFMFLDNDKVSIETGFGERKSFVLLDGSEVILNSKSQITYDEDNWNKERTLNLKGEAYFKVAKGEAFTVNTDNGSVTVLGTQFNVNSTNDFFDVVCYEGKVSVSTNSSAHILLPTHSVRKINGDPSESSTTQLLKPTWINGESTFKSIPIKYVITALEDQYNIKIDSESIDDTTIFSGSFPHNNLNNALLTVFEALHIKFKEKEKRNIKLRY